MADLTLVIGNKRFSSWSLRPWLALKATGVPFKEITVRLREPDSKQNILRYSPSGQVPLLLIGEKKVWDSLAICETLADMFPKANLWPKDSYARAHARALCAEMHSGFASLRAKHPMDLLGRISTPPEEDVQQHITRIEHLWREARSLSGSHQFLYGDFTIADAYYAPVVSRFITYGFTVAADTKSYMDIIWNYTAFRQWYSDAEKEL